MAYLITSDGERATVPMDHDLWRHETVGLFPENVKLSKVWVLEMNEKIGTDEIVFDHEPTENEILYEMSLRGLRSNDFVIIGHGYRLNYEWED